jgi:endonuclease YncB( thermonuclease family)
MPEPTVLQHIKKLVLLDQVRVVDGDTWWAYVDVDFRDIGLHEFRLFGYDTPEKQSSSTYKVSALEKAAAEDATQFSMDFFALSQALKQTVYVETQPDPEKYGRWLAQVWREDKAGNRLYLGEMLVQAQLATHSDGTKGTRWRDTYDKPAAKTTELIATYQEPPYGPEFPTTWKD